MDYASANAAYDSYLGIAGYTQFILSDVLAHHQVVVNTNLNGGSLSDVDLVTYYGYLPNREDYVFGLMRESHRYLFKFSDGHFEEVRDVDMGGFGQIIYPFSPALRVSGALGYRRLSRTGIWNSDADIDEDIVSLQTALVFDNALWGSVGPRVGSRLSLAGEIAPSISGSAEYNTILMDLRNYLWVSRNVTFATRLALGTSWGRDAQTFYIGGAIPHRVLWGEVETLNELIGFYTNYGDMLRGYDYASIYGRRYGVFLVGTSHSFCKYSGSGCPSAPHFQERKRSGFLRSGNRFQRYLQFQRSFHGRRIPSAGPEAGIRTGIQVQSGLFSLQARHRLALRPCAVYRRDRSTV